MKSYVVGELRTHNDLRQLIESIKFDLKAIGPELKDKLRSRIVRILNAMKAYNLSSRDQKV